MHLSIRTSSLGHDAARGEVLHCIAGEKFSSSVKLQTITSQKSLKGGGGHIWGAGLSGTAPIKGLLGLRLAVMTVCVVVKPSRIKKVHHHHHHRASWKDETPEEKANAKTPKKGEFCVNLSPPPTEWLCSAVFRLEPRQTVEARISRHVPPSLFSKLRAHASLTMRALKRNRIIHLSKGSSHKSGSVGLFSAGKKKNKKQQQLLLGVARAIGPEGDFLLSQYSVLGC